MGEGWFGVKGRKWVDAGMGVRFWMVPMAHAIELATFACGAAFAHLRVRNAL
jgi:type IV secretory pathway TrbD component